LGADRSALLEFWSPFPAREALVESQPAQVAWVDLGPRTQGHKNGFFPRSDRHADNVRVKCTDPGISEYIIIMYLSVFPFLYIFVGLVSQNIPLVVRLQEKSAGAFDSTDSTRITKTQSWRKNCGNRAWEPQEDHL